MEEARSVRSELLGGEIEVGAQLEQSEKIAGVVVGTGLTILGK